MESKRVFFRGSVVFLSDACDYQTSYRLIDVHQGLAFFGDVQACCAVCSVPFDKQNHKKWYDVVLALITHRPSWYMRFEKPYPEHHSTIGALQAGTYKNFACEKHDRCV